MYFLVFHGKERYDQNPDAHHGHHDDHHGHGDGKPHETPWVVTLPLVLLAIPSVLIGYFTIEPLLYGTFFDDAITVNTAAHPAMAELREMFHGALGMAQHSLSTAPLWLALAGVVTAWYMYLINPKVPAAIGKALRPLVVILENKYYMDWINENIIARGARMLGTGLWKGGDQGVIETGVVNASWKGVARLAAWVRTLQTGLVYQYALVMIVGAFVMLTVFVWLG